jgi:hypothetical protein
MTQSESQDAAFFQMISESVGQQPDFWVSPSDRRNKDRRSFPTVQSVAPYIDGHLPPVQDLRPVQCHDLSTTGISFLADSMPDYQRLLVALATPYQVIYLIGEVVHCKRVSLERAQPLFQIGCRFIERVQL